MDTQPTNVLVVEDDPITQNLIERMLSKSPQLLKCKLQTAATLSTAVEKLKTSRFDNILLNLSLPDSKGIDTFRRIQKANSRIPIVVLTSTNDK
ncbi:MAG: response regulator, partial [Planctomycetes bacterium]|nr:response regulator [Planctomycetota bacterium]